MRNYLNSHGCEDKQVGQIKSKRRYQKPKLVSLSSCCGLPWMKITKSCNGCGTTNPNHREIGREHLALKITKLVPRQIPKIYMRLKQSLSSLKHHFSHEYKMLVLIFQSEVKIYRNFQFHLEISISNVVYPIKAKFHNRSIITITS